MTVSESIGTDFWSEYENLNEVYLSGIPDLLPELDPNNGLEDAYKLSGPQFLYTKFALGMSIGTQQKLVEIVDGRGLVRGGNKRRVKWADVGSLLDSLAKSKLHDPIVGPAVAAERNRPA